MASGTSILKSIIQAVNPRDNACFEYTSGQWRTTTTAIGTTAGLKILKRYIFVGCTSGIPSNLGAFIDVVAIPSGTADLASCLRSFLPGNINLNARLRGWSSKTIFDVDATLVAVEPRDIDANLVAVEPRNITASIRAQWEGKNQFRSIIRGWWHNYWPANSLGGDLGAFVQPHVELDFPASLQVTQPVDIVAYLKVWPYKALCSNIQGYAVLDLLSRIKILTKSISNIKANIIGYRPVDFRAMVRAKVSGYHDLNAYLRALQIPINLGASMNYVYRAYSSLNTIVECLPIYLLNATITGWAEKNLSAYISTIMPPGYLSASITQHGTYRNLITYIGGFLAVTMSKNLLSFLSGWAYLDLKSSISTIDYISLTSSITSVGGAKNLSAYIKAREIIFNELYKLSTVNTADLRAYIGFSLCPLRTPVSAYVSLIASAAAVPTYDLSVIIEGIKTTFSASRGLGVFISYTNKYSMLSRFLSFKHSMSTSEAIRINPTFFKDSLNLTFKIIKGQQDLKTYITPEPHNVFLGASIRSRLLIIHGSGTDKVLTEELVELDGCRRVWSEYVDVYLHTEKPIYYSGGEVFAQNYGDPIVSFLFERVSSTGLNYSYNLTHNIFFGSTDVAIRYGFSKISGRRTFAVLSATVTPIIKHLNLNSKIECKKKISLYFDSPFTYFKSGTLSFMGTCVNSTLYKSKLSIFGGIQDMAGNVSGVRN